jgi:hypothetical protein
VCRIEARWTHAGDQNRRGAISRATAYPLKASRTLADLRVSVDPKAPRVLAAEAGDGVVVSS